MHTAKTIGRAGETLVATLLPDSVDLNIKGESHKPYDIEWNDIKIDVKTTRIIKPSCTFSVRPYKAHTGIILVYVATTDTDNYFWVERYSNKVKKVHRLSDAVSADQLVERIQQVLLTQHQQVTGEIGVTSMAIDVKIFKRFKKLLAIERKRSKRRHLYNEDFLIHLMNNYEQGATNGQ